MEILVKATAKAEKMPDTMVVKIDFFGLKKDKEESLKLLNTNVSSIKEYLNTKGISWDSVTTSKFSISEEYTNQRVVVKKLGREETEYQRVFIGYRTKQSISFTKDLDIELAVKLIAEITKKTAQKKLVLCDFVFRERRCTRRVSCKKDGGSWLRHRLG